MLAPKSILPSPPRRSSENTDTGIRIRVLNRLQYHILCLSKCVHTHTHTAPHTHRQRCCLGEGCGRSWFADFSSTGCVKNKTNSCFFRIFWIHFLCFMLVSVMFQYLRPCTCWPLFFFFLLRLFLSSSLCNTALRSTALLPNWPMVGREGGAKWSLGDFKRLWIPWVALGCI